MTDQNTNTCVECNERPALGLPKKQGRMHDTCSICLGVLAQEGVDITKPKPKPKGDKPKGKRAAKKEERQARFDLIEQRAQRKKAADQPAETVDA